MCSTYLAHQTNVSYATEFVKCICDGQRDDGVLGFEPMLAAVETCSTCYQTPNVIRGDLNVSISLALGIDQLMSNRSNCWTSVPRLRAERLRAMSCRLLRLGTPSSTGIRARIRRSKGQCRP